MPCYFMQSNHYTQPARRQAGVDKSGIKRKRHPVGGVRLVLGMTVCHLFAPHRPCMPPVKCHGAYDEYDHQHEQYTGDNSACRITRDEEYGCSEKENHQERKENDGSPPVIETRPFILEVCHAASLERCLSAYYSKGDKKKTYSKKE